MQPTASFTWQRVVTFAHWIASSLGGIALVGWAVWTLILVPYGTGNAGNVQWAIWGVLSVSLAIAVFVRGIGELGAGLVLVVGAVAMVVLSELQGPALLVISLWALAGVLFIACSLYTLTHPHPHGPHATA